MEHANDALVREGAWLRRLAFELVADPGCAEDVAQSAWIAAATHRARSSRPGFLGRILRNALRQEQRGESRRRNREQQVVEARSEASSLEVVERLDLQRFLVDTLRELEEPYRETLVLRFLDDLPPREVARRMGVPPKTVQTRIARGLTRLRERLDRSAGGDRTRWLGACALLAADGRGPLGGALLGAKLKLAGLGLAIAAVGTAVVLRPGGVDAPRGSVATRDTLAAPGVVPGEPVEVGGIPAAPREPVRVVSGPDRAPQTTPGPEGAATRSEAPALAPRVLHGLVRDAGGDPVGNARLAFPLDEGGEARIEGAATSRADGSFELTVPGAGSGFLVATRDDLVTLVRARVQAGPPVDDYVVVVAPRRSFTGRVVDPAGLPLEGALIDLRLGDEVVRRIRFGIQETWIPLEVVHSDEAGEFRLADVAYVEGLELHYTRDGYDQRMLELPPHGEDLILVLAPLAPGPSLLVGRVEDKEGRPVAGARVSAGTTSALSERDGEFVVELLANERPELVRAVVKGLLPAQAEIAWSDVGPAPVRLVVGDGPLELAGRVLDEAGLPVAEAPVWVEEGTPFGMVPFDTGDFRSFHYNAKVEDLVAGGERQSGLLAWTDGEGRFHLPSLLARSYAVDTLHPGTLELASRRDVAAGDTGLELRFRGQATRRVAGRLTSLDGRPLAGYRVTPYHLTPGVGRQGTRLERTTDQEGRFDLGGLVTESLVLEVQGVRLSQQFVFDVDDSPDPGNLSFAIPAQCQVRVVLESAEGDEVQLLDAGGESLTLAFEVGQGWLASDRIGVVGGRTGSLLVDETARTVVLLSEGREVLRRDVSLVPDEVTEIRL